MKKHLHPRRNRAELDATKVPTALDIAWAAGIFEGEGHVRLCGGVGKRGFMISIAQKDPELLYRLRDWFGGSVCFHYATYGGERYKLHTLNICGDRARVFMAVIYPYLTARRKQQADATSWNEFLGLVSPAYLMSMDEAKNRLAAFYEDQRSNMWRGRSAASREALKKYHREHQRTYRARRRNKDKNLPEKPAEVVCIAG